MRVLRSRAIARDPMATARASPSMSSARCWEKQALWYTHFLLEEGAPAMLLPEPLSGCSWNSVRGNFFAPARLFLGGIVASWWWKWGEVEDSEERNTFWTISLYKLDRLSYSTAYPTEVLQCIELKPKYSTLCRNAMFLRSWRTYMRCIIIQYDPSNHPQTNL